MSTPNKKRGEYRPIYEALFHSPEYLSLSSDARLVLVTLKSLCGAIGVKSWPALDASLSELCGLLPRRVRAALSELEEARWIEREGNVVWVVNGLRFEPSDASIRLSDVRVERFEQAEAVLRTVQEALTNCAKHAQARTVTLTLCSNARPITLTIVDDGIGFDDAWRGDSAIHSFFLLFQ